jgi:hypothetical protein
MKVLCYFILVVAFLMYYQKNPFYTVIIIGVGIGFYVFFRSRKSGRGTFLSGKRNVREERMDDLMMLIMLQQLFNQPQSREAPQDKNPHKNRDHNESKLYNSEQEILDLLEEE